MGWICAFIVFLGFSFGYAIAMLIGLSREKSMRDAYDKELNAVLQQSEESISNVCQTAAQVIEMKGRKDPI